jgi:predicted dienelactone hydrolase
MQNLELLLLIASSAYMVLYRLINRNLNKLYVMGLLVLVLVIHLVFDGPRWQMIPAYVLWLIASITAMVPSDRKPAIVLRVLKITGLLVLLALSIALPSALPVFDLPQATGPYAVGTMDINLTLDREEVITADKTDSRSLMIKAWYPSKEQGGEMDPYVDPAGRNGFAQKYGLAPSMLNYLNKVETNVYRNTQMADETFPVLIFSHGYNSKANGYYALLTELASHGYVVFAINHTYESTGSTFPDGTMKYFDYAYASQIESGTWGTMEPVIEAFKSGLSFEDRHPIVREGLTTYFVRDMVERWTQDIVDVVSELDAWNSSGFFEEKLDLSQVGAFGHSRGGGPAGEALLVDGRIKAAANIDGVQWGQMVDTVLQKPFLFLSADWPAEHENLNQHAYVNRSTSVFYEGMVLQSGHSNFMDIPFMIPLRALSQAGDIDPDLGMEITRAVVTSFFDKHLKNKAVDMNALNAEYEMLKLSVFTGDSLVSDRN